ncbi:hypothetical protein [Diaphorobacter sp. MNS-0]|nr:hypothetical protein [Diaphorobacter sp. MNS-0]
MSSPSKCRSSHTGRTASSMASDIAPITSTPLYCTQTVRSAK